MLAAALATTSLLPMLGCDKPVAPQYAAASQSGAVGLADAVGFDVNLRDGNHARIEGDGGIELVLAYDGKKLHGYVESDRPAADRTACPEVVYLATSGGSQRHEFRFLPDDVRIWSNGREFGGADEGRRRRIATRAKVDGKQLRFAIPTLGGDVAIHVAGCHPFKTASGLPTLVVNVGSDGLTWGPPAGPTVVGLRPMSAPKTPVTEDSKRYAQGAPVLLMGANLDTVTDIEIGDLKVQPQKSTANWLGFVAPSVGDTGSLTVYAGDAAATPVGFAVEGSVDKIEDAMGSFAGSVWGMWLVFLLVGSGIILTITNGFPQFRGFRHAIKVVRGRFDDPKEKGEINHFQALTAALSATVGLGNIAGVAVAVTAGGPGAIFWMWVCGFLGMATKYAECTLAVASREVRPDGTVAGGPMYTMRNMLPSFLKPLGLVFAVFITIASFGGGNMFQANQAAALWQANFGVPTWVTGLLLVGLVGLVIIGGIKRIGNVTDKLVPTMCGIYVIAALAVIGTNIEQVPDVFAMIFREAFNVSAAVGGVLGIVLMDVLRQGFRRAAFSNEAGLGSAAIAHAAVKTDEPVREGTVALLEPFIDTVVICTMTGLVILFSGLWTQQGLEGATLTAAAFDSAFDGFGSYLVPVAVFLFAISTMISWSYYGEKGIEFVFGRRAILPYRVFFVCLIFIGAIWKLGPVLDFSDAILGLVAVPNLIAVLVLVPKLRELTNDYFGRLKSGEMPEIGKKTG